LSVSVTLIKQKHFIPATWKKSWTRLPWHGTCLHFQWSAEVSQTSSLFSGPVPTLFCFAVGCSASDSNSAPFAGPWQLLHFSPQPSGTCSWSSPLSAPSRCLRLSALTRGSVQRLLREDVDWSSFSSPSFCTLLLLKIKTTTDGLGLTVSTLGTWLQVLFPLQWVCPSPVPGPPRVQRWAVALFSLLVSAEC
jgi:hypothetical protein